MRSKAFDVLLVLWTLLLSPALPILWSTNAASRRVRAVSQLWANGLMLILRVVVGLKYVERGRENIPDGPVNIDSSTDAVLPAKPAVYQSIEGLIQHFEVLMPNRGYAVPCEELYAATESPNGELGFYIVGDGNVRAYRARTRPPSYIHFAMLPHMIRDYQLSDLVAILGSINIIAAELDR